MGIISIVLVVVVFAVQVLGSDLFAQQMLDAHNLYRQEHNVPALTLSPEISAYTQELANQLAEQNKLAIRPNNKYGQNFYWASGEISDGSVPTVAWMKGLKNYDFSKAKHSPSSKSFTQVVWRATRYLGVGIGRSANGASFVVANYDPAGNVQGQFAENVLIPST